MGMAWSSAAGSLVQASAMASLSWRLSVVVSGWQSWMCLRKLLTFATGSAWEHTMQKVPRP